MGVAYLGASLDWSNVQYSASGRPAAHDLRVQHPQTDDASDPGGEQS